MTGIQNPVLPGFNPDPSILRVGPDYYIATSTFEWFPAIQLHHSTDLDSWELIGHAVHDDSLHMRGIPASGGVWAPCLTRDPSSGRFFLVFSVMKSQVAEDFDVDNYVIWADDVRGPWSEPVFLTAVGFDPSLFHDDDGTSWLTTLEWETRVGREHPGWIVAQSFDRETFAVGEPVRIHHGTTDRGAMEAPHLYKHEGTYYLMTAEGGTGYGHGVCLARSSHPLGTYESDPDSPFITRWPPAYFGRNNREFLRPEFYNPHATVQKAGHGSLVQGEDGDWYVAHLSSRPLPGTLNCVLGRETSIQRVEWRDGWLRMPDGDPLAREFFEGPPQTRSGRSMRELDVHADFENGISAHFATLRTPMTPDWCGTSSGGLTLVGRDSLSSLFDVSLVATRLRSFDAEATTTVSFDPTHFSQSAGLAVYYNNRNYAYLRVTWNEDLQSRTLGLVVSHDAVKHEFPLEERALHDGAVHLRARISGGQLQFAARPDRGTWAENFPVVDITHLSDESAGGFTGTFVGMVAVDGLTRALPATFTHFALEHDADGEETTSSVSTRSGEAG